jgi:hypothetical protein
MGRDGEVAKVDRPLRRAMLKSLRAEGAQFEQLRCCMIDIEEGDCSIHLLILRVRFALPRICCPHNINLRRNQNGKSHRRDSNKQRDYQI